MHIPLHTVSSLVYSSHMDATKNEWAYCPYCDKSIQLRNDGMTLRVHGPLSSRCFGSGLVITERRKRQA